VCVIFPAIRRLSTLLHKFLPLIRQEPLFEQEIPRSSSPARSSTFPARPASVDPVVDFYQSNCQGAQRNRKARILEECSFCPGNGSKFSGKYVHRTITGGVGHNLPQEAPQAFARAIIDVDRY
jgi:hypothetical protein